MRSSSTQSEEPQSHNSISGDNASGLLKNAQAHISPCNPHLLPLPLPVMGMCSPDKRFETKCNIQG